ncbi:MAG: glycosyltransferase family 39 protein [Anaerolineae bacterium]|nr:glycosyltransferase family 39 protein [Anaerolineae bacterium]MCI0611251.1 glycosyltransferase family 39 protein [Anaerolineae bacterium]
MNDEIKETDPLEEPSVLDYVKSLFRFGNGERIQIPSFVEAEQEESQPAPFTLTQPEIIPASEQRLQSFDKIQDEPSPFTPHPSTPFPWRSLFALFLALLGQNFFEPPQTSLSIGYAFYIATFSLLGWAIYRGEWTLAPLPPSSEGTDPLTYRPLPLFISIALALLAFIILGDNLFTFTNVVVWSSAVVFLLSALWLKGKDTWSLQKTIAFFKRDPWTINISRWTLLLLAATALVFFFRFYQTVGVPPEPFSDHAEKILDVYDISQGQTSIFFIRNTGREGFQMYWTLLVARIFGTGLSFTSLKLGTAILGFLTLPFVYLLGKEIGGARVGLFAFILTGISYWPNVISRVGLRFPLYPLFVALTLLFLIRGLRTRNRNDFLLSGLFLGIGLHGYSAMRIVPFVVVAIFVLYWFHSQSQGARRELPIWLTILALVSMFVFLPLLRYWMDYPAEYGYRVSTRMTGLEQSITEPIPKIFLSNVWNALKMFNYDNGEVWVASVTQRPALDVISGALFLIGLVLVIVRYIRNRHWLDLLLLVSIPLLQLPSTLSLAFPNENPTLNRAGAAYIPAFILGAMALDGLLTSFGRGRMRSVLVWIISGVLLYASASQSYDLVFREYKEFFREASWNTSDIARVIKEFELTFGRTDTIWVVPFPHWVDTRLPAVWVGIPDRDMAMWRENLPDTVELTGPKLFMVKADVENPDGNDQESLNVLRELYPNGQLRMFDSDVPRHDFWIFLVPNQ